MNYRTPEDVLSAELAKLRKEKLTLKAEADNIVKQMQIAIDGFEGHAAKVLSDIEQIDGAISEYEFLIAKFKKPDPERKKRPTKTKAKT